MSIKVRKEDKEFIDLNLNFNAHFENVEKMKKCILLSAGSVCKTLGYYEANDGGGATYLIREKTSNDIEDGGSIHFVGDSLVAELIINKSVNIKQFGAKADGTTDNTTLIQTALNKYKAIEIPRGTFKITRITLNQYNKITGKSPRLSILSSDETEYCLILPQSSDHCLLQNFTVTSGIEIGVQGTSSVQDINNTIENVRCTGGAGIRLHQRGNLLRNIRVGGAKTGYYITGTDNILEDCICAVIDGHGFNITNSNNLIQGSKAFCCGKSEYGCGFYIAGAFTRLVGCEAQQNYYENYVFKNSFGTTAKACSSDGAFWGKSEQATYNNSEFGVINTSSVFLHNLEGVQLDITIVNGSKFDNIYSAVTEGLGFKYYGLIKRCNINVTLYNRNNYNAPLSTNDLMRLAICNKINGNENDYNSLFNHTQIYSKKSVSFEDNTQATKTLVGQKISNDTKKVFGFIEKVDDKTNLSSLFVDVMCVLVKDGTTLYKNTSSTAISDNINFMIDVESFLKSQSYDSITSISIRILARNNANVGAFNYNIENVRLAQFEDIFE